MKLKLLFIAIIFGLSLRLFGQSIENSNTVSVLTKYSAYYNNSMKLSWIAADLGGQKQYKTANILFSHCEEIENTDGFDKVWRELRPCYVMDLFKDGRSDEAQKELNLVLEDIRFAFANTNSIISSRILQNGKLHRDVENRLNDLYANYFNETHDFRIKLYLILALGNNKFPVLDSAISIPGQTR